MKIKITSNKEEARIRKVRVEGGLEGKLMFISSITWHIGTDVNEPILTIKYKENMKDKSEKTITTNTPELSIDAEFDVCECGADDPQHVPGGLNCRKP